MGNNYTDNPIIDNKVQLKDINEEVGDLGEGVLLLKKTDEPEAKPGYGKMYCKSDDKPYFKDENGVETDLTSGSGGSPETNWHKRIVINYTDTIIPIMTSSEITAIKSNGRIFFKGFRAIIAELPFAGTGISLDIGDDSEVWQQPILNETKLETGFGVFDEQDISFVESPLGDQLGEELGISFTLNGSPTQGSLVIHVWGNVL